MSSAYLGRPDYRHGETPLAAVVLVNLGTPDATDVRSIRRYLAEFLSDPRVIELPRALWLPILYGAILPFRARRSAHAYRQVWMLEGSPLRVHSQALAGDLEVELRASGMPLTVRLAMRYGQPSIPNVLRQLQDEGLRRVLILPLYPQYSATTTASVFDAVSAELARWRWVPELRTVGQYHAEPAWIDAVAGSIRQHWDAHGRGERLLFSFHGIPRRYFLAGDPYFCQCQHSAREIAARLGLAESDWQVAFQSRVGREEWLRPYTDETIRALAKRGVRRLDVVCPGFAVDCLETLEEIAMQNADAFRAAGGEALNYLPALNASLAHVHALAVVVRRHGSGWPEFEPDPDREAQARANERSAQRHAAFARDGLSRD